MTKTRIPFGAWAVGGLAGILLGVSAVASLTSSGVDTSPQPPFESLSGADEESLSPSESKAANTAPVLPKKERTLIWDIEHQALELAEYGLKAISTALAHGDAQSLRRLMAPNFRAEAPGPDSELRRDTGLVVAVRRRDEGRGPEVFDRDGFVKRLLEFRSLYGENPKAKLSIKSFAPVSRDDFEGRWRGSALLRMWGKSKSNEPIEVIVNLSLETSHPENDVVAPENDDLPEGSAPLVRDGWWHSAAISQSLTTRAPRYLMKEVANERGLNPAQLWDNWSLDEPKDGKAVGGENGADPATEKRNPATNTGGAYCTDYDRDGYVDMLVLDLTGVYFYRGLADGKFENATAMVGLEPFNRPEAAQRRRDLAVFIDIDADGWDDLLLGETVFQNRPHPTQAGRRFYPVERAYLIVPDLAVGAAVADYDHDGLLDLYFFQTGQGKADSWLDGKSGNFEPNILWKNVGNWVFKKVAESAGAGGGFRSTFASAWFDADNDNWSDLYVINEFGDGVLLLNNRDGTFREKLLSDRPVDYGSMGLAAGDINNDGKIDLYVANMYSKAGNRVIGNLQPDAYDKEIMDRLNTFTVGSQLYLNRGDGKFDGVGRDWQVHDVGWAYGPTLADLDNDGLLDLYATCGFISRDRKKPDG